MVLEGETEERDVPQPQSGDEFVAFAHSLFAQVQSDEFAVRPLRCDRNEIRAVAAPEFQHAAAIERRRAHAEEQAEGGDMIGMRLAERVSRIADAIVSGRALVGRSHSGIPGGRDIRHRSSLKYRTAAPTACPLRITSTRASGNS